MSTETKIGVRTKDISGLISGRLLVLPLFSVNERKEAMWFCKCECGNIVKVKGGSLKRGHTKSCGCLHPEIIKKVNITHGYTSNGMLHPLYRTWVSMTQRCSNPKSKGYSNYGGRGIKVCERWKNSFELFLEDIGEQPSKNHTIDRYPDNNGNYEPSNFRWATKKQQMENVRYNVWHEYKGVKKTITDWGRTLKASNGLIYFHLKKGRTMDWIIEYLIKRNNISI